MLKFIGISLAVVIAFGAIGIGGVYLNTLANVATAPARVIDRTVTTDNIIDSYEYYFDAYGKIKTAFTVVQNNKSAIDSFVTVAGDHDKWTFEDKQEFARLNSMYTGSKNGYNDLVNQYNAQASKANHNIFKDHSLPDHVDPEV